MIKKSLCISLCLSATLAVGAQTEWKNNETAEPMRPLEGLTYHVEAQATASDGTTPLWLNANRYGLSSLESTNGYLRAGLIRPLRQDSLRRWGIGYGLDLVATYHHTANPVVHQAFAQVRWLHGTLLVGSKELPMQLKNNQLSSGSQTLGINARPIPQVRLALDDYWALPFANGWLQLKGHVAYGKFTDDNWQKDFTRKEHQYTEDARFHSKAGFLRIGKDETFFPFSVEMGLEMASIFGGTSYNPLGDEVTIYKGNNGLKGMWKAFLPGGADAPEEGTAYQNAEGDLLGSWMLRLNYNTDTWRLGLYADKYFEDHSSMLQLDYNGYGTGDEWNTRKDWRYFIYDLKDMMLGMELNLKYGSWLRDIVVEYIYTRYQSGPVYHDHTQAFPTHISGQDSYYNHYIYTGWQHWGQAIGNPLYRSPLYNTDGKIEFENNRFMAFHLGVSGEPLQNLTYRVLATWQEGFGTYDQPYTKRHHNVSVMAEAAYRMTRGWCVRAALGMDAGYILGHNYGAQLTISKSGLLSKTRKKTGK